MMTKRAEKIVNKLKKRQWHIAFAETITGGGLTKSIIEIPTSSTVLGVSLVTYSDQSKIDLLGVNPDTIRNYGAVSEQTVKEMAYGLIEKFKSEVAVAISGIAGPTGDRQGKPLGMICLAIITPEGIFPKTLYCLGKSRKVIMNECVNSVLNYLDTLI